MIDYSCIIECTYVQMQLVSGIIYADKKQIAIIQSQTIINNTTKFLY